MVSITVVTRAGKAQILTSAPDLSLMEIMRNGGIDGLLASCGGCCSCATCHVYVDDLHFSDFPPADPDEDELLESSAHRTANSRLSCQLQAVHVREGLRLEIAPED